MATPHNRAKKGDFAKVCIMPGDPLRAKWIAETFLNKVILVNDIRGILGFTGYYKGVKVSVMAHGMGIPSIGIYSYELFKFYGVDYIIRVGSTGSLVKEIKVGSVFIGKEAWSKSDFVKEIKVKTDKGVLKPSKKLYDLAIQVCKEHKIPFHTGRILSSDVFYTDYNVAQLRKRSGGAQVTEMESTGLFAVAQKLKKQALTILTTSDSLVTHEEMSAEERVTKFKDMVKIALEVAVKVLKKK